MSCEPILFCNYSCVVHMEYIFISIFIFHSRIRNWTVNMSDNLPERVQILGHAHIICITVWEDRIICCQIICDLLLRSAFERIFNVMQLTLVKIKWHIKWKYLIQKFHDICLSYYFNRYGISVNKWQRICRFAYGHCIVHIHLYVIVYYSFEHECPNKNVHI